MNNRKKLVVMIITCLLVVLIGSSYALLRSSHKGTNPYTINVGLLEVDFYGNTTNLTLSNAYPMTDEEGLQQNQELVFTVKNTGSIKANYKVYIEETSTNPEFKTVIRYVDKKGSNEYSDIKTLSEDNYIDKNGELNTQESETYRVKAWLAESADSTYMNKVFKAKIVIESSQVRTIASDLTSKVANLSYVKNYTTEIIANNPTFTTQDTYDTNSNKQDVYYYTGSEAKEHNNVLFAGYCWQIIRTTDTGGVKLLYNGVAENNQCLTDRNSSNTIKGINGEYTTSITGMETTTTYGTGFTYAYNETTSKYEFTLTGVETNKTWSSDLVGMYTCKETNTTCETIYQLGRFVNSTTAAGAYYTIGNLDDKYTIGKTPFNGTYDSLNYVGYMFNDNVYLTTSGTLAGVYANDVKYENNAYTLLTTTTSQDYFDKDHHYICNNLDCTQVRYYYRKYTSNNVDYYYYILLSGGKRIEDVLYETLNYKWGETKADIDLNIRNSSIKAYLESWYYQNLNSYASYIDDTATYCNDRTIAGLGSLDKNSSNISSVMTFKNYNAGSKDLRCESIQDRFSVQNDKARLSYPIGLISENERALMGDAAGDGVTDKYYWGSSPHSFDYSYAHVRIVSSSGATDGYNVYSAYGARPAVSLRPATSITSGDGGYETPYIVGPIVQRTIS